MFFGALTSNIFYLNGLVDLMPEKQHSMVFTVNSSSFGGSFSIMFKI